MSFRIATIRGIPVRVHVTLLAILAILAFSLGLKFGLLAGVALFGSVLLHELGHSVVAQAFGIRIKSIYLHILGGMAMMTELPRTPRQELLIAAAGPAVSFVIAALLYGLLTLVPFGGAPEGLLALMQHGWRPHQGLADPSFSHLAAWTMTVNFGMFLFNLVPALPMDGGRIFRAGLAMKLGAIRATTVAAWVSRAFGLAFIVLGIASGSWSLPVIGLLLFFMVANEVRVVRMQEMMKNGVGRAPFPFASAFFRGAGGLGGFRMRRPSPYDDGSAPVIDVGAPKSPEVSETRQEFIDAWGRRWVVVTRVAE
ncbi:site-2 protease family protein [Myxococcota bacterium]|nr:site-2 protease family protein [Myxococcota bacterium]